MKKPLLALAAFILVALLLTLLPSLSRAEEGCYTISQVFPGETEASLECPVPHSALNGGCDTLQRIPGSPVSMLVTSTPLIDVLADDGTNAVGAMMGWRCKGTQGGIEVTLTCCHD